MPDDCDIGGEAKDPVVCGDVVIVPVLKTTDHTVISLETVPNPS